VPDVPDVHLTSSKYSWNDKSSWKESKSSWKDGNEKSGVWNDKSSWKEKPSWSDTKASWKDEDKEGVDSPSSGKESKTSWTSSTPPLAPAPKAISQLPLPTPHNQGSMSGAPADSLQPPDGVLPKGGQVASVQPVAPPPKAAMQHPEESVSAAAVAAIANDDDVVKQSVLRLRENGQRKFYWDEVSRLKKEFGLSERVELAMKLLKPAKLNSLLRENGDLPRQLQCSPDKDQFIRLLVKRQDEIVDQLVSQLEQKDKGHKKGCGGRPEDKLVNSKPPQRQPGNK